jgi:hypothetical protein
MGGQRVRRLGPTSPRPTSTRNTGVTGYQHHHLYTHQQDTNRTQSDVSKDRRRRSPAKSDVISRYFRFLLQLLHDIFNLISQQPEVIK